MASEASRRAVAEEDLTNVEIETNEDVELIRTFDSMGLKPIIKVGVKKIKIKFIYFIKC